MNFKRLLRKLKYKFGPKEFIFDNGPFSKLDTELLMDRNVAVTICSYNEIKGVYVILISSVDIKEC